MKILPRAFVLLLSWSLLLSTAAYFLLRFLSAKFAPFILPFVFLISVLLCVILCYLCAAHYRIFSASLEGERLIVTKGFLINRKNHMNLRFAVSIKSFSTPLMRLMKLSNILILFEGSACLLPLIKAEDAQKLSNIITEISEKNKEI